MTLLPVTNITLPRKALILEAFDKLREGESFIFSNVYNPFILYFQLLDDRGDTFHWQYLEEGPLLWRVKITRKNAGPKT